MRRIVTGQAPDGASVFTHVEGVDPQRLGGDMIRHTVWGWDEIPTLPFHSVAAFEGTGLPDTVGAARIEIWVLPPHFPLDGGHEDSLRMHSTDTVDVVFVLEGEISLQQSDGAEVALRRGDVVVQNGAVHMWRNRTDKPCVLGEILLGATRRSETAAKSS